jgi:hypothetical protein
VIQELFLAGTPDKMPWLVDFFPIRERLIPNPNIWILKLILLVEKLPNWFPCTRFKKLAKQWSDCFQEFTNAPFQLVKEEMVSRAAGMSEKFS